MIFTLMKPVPVQTATMYSYNGTVLPALPEWDKEAYPYCAIGMFGTLYCYSVTDGTTDLIAPFLEFELIDEDTHEDSTFEAPDKFHWGECKIIETDDYIRIPIWANHDLGSLTASEPVPVYLPITLFDGERTFSIGSWEDPSDYTSASASIGLKVGFGVGDTLEITLDGHTETYTARKVDTFNGVFAGNNGLNGNDTDGVDDGGDILVTFPHFGSSAWGAYLYTRTLGTHKVTIKLIGVK